MSEEIDKHVLKKYEVQQRLGKGVSICRRAARRAVVELRRLLPARTLVYLLCCTFKHPAGVWHRVEGH